MRLGKKDEAESVKEKKEENHAQFKIVSKRDSAIMQDKGYPGGWLNRAQERSDASSVQTAPSSMVRGSAPKA